MESQTASTEQSVKTIDADIEYIVLGIKKLDAYFADKQVAKKYLTRDGWLDGRGVSELRRYWNAYALCFVLMSVSFTNIPKTKEVADLINDKLKDTGSTVTLRKGNLGLYFGLNAKNFFWFGGLKRETV